MATETILPDFQPTNMVERQLVAAANGNADQQNAFERFILEETLYVATPEVASEGLVTLQADTKVQLLNVPLNDGRQAAAVFTSPQLVGEAFGEVGYMGIQGRALFEMIRAQPAVLNPGQVYCVVWEPENMTAMLGLPIQRVVQKETNIMLGVPADPPTELIERLKEEFSSIPQIEAAWLALAIWPETQEQAWYLDVRTASTDHKPIQRALPIVVDGIDLKGYPLDMVINGTDSADGTGIPIVKSDRTAPTKKGLLSRLFG
jgi:SseB protein C-terminal domain/SseB protein N-terminal domain